MGSGDPAWWAAVIFILASDVSIWPSFQLSLNTYYLNRPECEPMKKGSQRFPWFQAPHSLILWEEGTLKILLTMSGMSCIKLGCSVFYRSAWINAWHVIYTTVQFFLEKLHVSSFRIWKKCLIWGGMCQDLRANTGNMLMKDSIGNLYWLSMVHRSSTPPSDMTAKPWPAQQPGVMMSCDICMEEGTDIDNVLFWHCNPGTNAMRHFPF